MSMNSEQDTTRETSTDEDMERRGRRASAAESYLASTNDSERIAEARRRIMAIPNAHDRAEAIAEHIDLFE